MASANGMPMARMVIGSSQTTPTSSRASFAQPERPRHNPEWLGLIASRDGDPCVRLWKDEGRNVGCGDGGV